MRKFDRTSNVTLSGTDSHWVCTLEGLWLFLNRFFVHSWNILIMRIASQRGIGRRQENGMCPCGGLLLMTRRPVDVLSSSQNRLTSVTVSGRGNKSLMVSWLGKKNYSISSSMNRWSFEYESVNVSHSLAGFESYKLRVLLTVLWSVHIHNDLPLAARIQCSQWLDCRYLNTSGR